MEQREARSDFASLSFVVDESFHGARLDHYLVRMVAGMSRSRIMGAVKSKEIHVNRHPVKAGYRLKTGDHITGVLAERKKDALPVPQPVDFTVLHEDPALLVIDKPWGLVVHPGSGNRDRTLVNGLLFHYRDVTGVGDRDRPGIVHRLDKDTTGVMVVARTAKAHRTLVDSFKNRLVEKWYLALVHGTPDSPSGRIVAPIGRHRVMRQKMAVDEGAGRYAATSWVVRRSFPSCSLVEVNIETGRTHQIRVHMAHIGHPVAGDGLYGSNRVNREYPRTMLHAWRLRLVHPETSERMLFEAPLPADFTSVLHHLEDM